MSLVLMILALVFFLLACIPQVPQKFNFVAAGLALWELAGMVGGTATWWPR